MSVQFSNRDGLALNSGLDREDCSRLVKVLSRFLADEQVICTKTRKYHWNVVGPLHFALHRLFAEQCGDLAANIDRIAGQIRAYGLPAIGTLEEFLDYARLPESPGDYPSADEMLMDLIQDHEALARDLREELRANGPAGQDAATSEMLAQLLQQHLQMIWTLRASLPAAEM